MTDNPFHVGSRITDSRYFVGRQDALRNLADRVTQDQPTNVNLVGARRLGKSSVLGQFCRTAEQLIVQRGKDAGRYVVVYLSLRAAQCQSRLGFYQAVARVLLGRPVVANKRVLAHPLRAKKFDQLKFQAALEQWRDAGVLPVVCLDEIEECFERATEFDDPFFDNLRALTEAGLLMFVVASQESLDHYCTENPQLSKFSALFVSWPLEPFTVAEVDELMAKSGTLRPSFQTLVREWGESHPYLLQLAGDCLWQAQQYGKPESWARQQFEQKRQYLAADEESPQPVEPREPPKQLWRVGCRWFGKMPQQLGRLAQWIGENQETLLQYLVGIAIILGFLIFVTQKLLGWDLIDLNKIIENFLEQ